MHEFTEMWVMLDQFRHLARASIGDSIAVKSIENRLDNLLVFLEYLRDTNMIGGPHV